MILTLTLIWVLNIFLNSSFIFSLWKGVKLITTSIKRNKFLKTQSQYSFLNFKMATICLFLNKHENCIYTKWAESYKEPFGEHTVSRSFFINAGVNVVSVTAVSDGYSMIAGEVSSFTIVDFVIITQYSLVFRVTKFQTEISSHSLIALKWRNQKERKNTTIRQLRIYLHHWIRVTAKYKLLLIYP